MSSHSQRVRQRIAGRTRRQHGRQDEAEQALQAKQDREDILRMAARACGAETVDVRVPRNLAEARAGAGDTGVDVVLPDSLRPREG